MIALIGLGLTLNEITEEGLKLARSCDELYLDSYTSPIPFSQKSIEDLLGKKVNLVGREDLESDRLLDLGKKERVGLLTIGDPMSATTHSSLLDRARELDVEAIYVPGISIITVAPALLGLQHYKFGRIVTIPHPSKGEVRSPYDQIADNYPLHSLILLDSDPPLSAEGALSYLEAIDEGGGRIFEPDRAICVISRARLEDEEIWVGTIAEGKKKRFRSPSVLVLPGKLHFSEEEGLTRFVSGKLNLPPKAIEDRVRSEILSRYYSITEKALAGLKNKKLTDIEKRYLEICKNYYKDGLYFKERGDYVRAYGAINYGHAFLDAIKIGRGE